MSSTTSSSISSSSSWVPEEAPKEESILEDYEQVYCDAGQLVQDITAGESNLLRALDASTSLTPSTRTAEGTNEISNGRTSSECSTATNGGSFRSNGRNDAYALVVDEAPNWPTGLNRYSQHDVGRSLPSRLLHIGPLFAIFIVLVIGLTTSVLHTTWWPITSALGCADLLVFITWNYLVLHNLLKAAFIGGGYVSLGWHPLDQTHYDRLQYCHKCNGFKAPRSHHCAKCNRCVMKMDHHCPWINNCVGHRNQVYFMRFLAFAVIGCLHGAVILSLCIWETLSVIYWADPYRHPINKRRFIIDSIYSFMAAVLAVSFAFGVILAVGFLFFIQLRSAWRNKTGIEQYICLKAEYRGREESEDFIYPYDLGWRRNLAEVLNRGLSCAKGNGVWWPVVNGCDQFTLTEEQLEQKRLKQEYARNHPNRGLSNSWWSRFKRRFILPVYKTCFE